PRRRPDQLLSVSRVEHGPGLAAGDAKLGSFAGFRELTLEVLDRPARCWIARRRSRLLSFRRAVAPVAGGGEAARNAQCQRETRKSALGGVHESRYTRWP